MNVIHPIHAPAIDPGRFGKIRSAAMPGEAFIPVTVDGARLLVYHVAGRATWCHLEMGDGTVLPGVRASDTTPDSLHGAAVQVADGVLAGLRRAGEYPSTALVPKPMAAWRMALLSVAAGIAAFIVMWGVIALASLRDWQR
ncbi:MAG: hypothetical protein K2X46_08585 [Roseomonas sp.]|nr:hypothetical protein [Roseomonas sp.]